METDSQWADGARQFQRIFGEGWAQVLKGLQPPAAAAAAGASSTAAAALPSAPVRFAPDKLAALQAKYLEEAKALWSEGLQTPPAVADRRFTSEAWSKSPMARFSAAAAGGFQHHGVADAVGLGQGHVDVGEVGFAAFDEGHTAALGHFLGGYFVAERLHHLGARAHENDVFFAAAAGQGGVFAEEAVAGVDGIGAVCLGLGSFRKHQKIQRIRPAAR